VTLERTFFIAAGICNSMSAFGAKIPTEHHPTEFSRSLEMLDEALTVCEHFEFKRVVVGDDAEKAEMVHEPQDDLCSSAVVVTLPESF
jgi:hypothetical protein